MKICYLQGRISAWYHFSLSPTVAPPLSSHCMAYQQRVPQQSTGNGDTEVKNSFFLRAPDPSPMKNQKKHYLPRAMM
jgi:hypothetical protein